MSGGGERPTKAELEQFRAGGAFDAGWYLSQYPDVAASGLDPAEHFLWLGRAMGRMPSGKPAPAEAGGGAVPPVVVVPVYNAPEELARCLAALTRNSGGSLKGIVIDDASPDPRVADVLAAYGGDVRLRFERNESNLGFTRTANRGITLAGRADVVLLNADTEVPPGCLRNLQRAAYSGERVATATPLSDNAGAFSAPEADRRNDLPAGLSPDDAGRLVQRGSERLYPEVPTGHGFCLYMRRACLDQIGVLDAEAFPRGYGEENDFCLRTRAAGWTHVIDDATYLHHVRSASFGVEKTELIRQGREVLDHRYPDYQAALAVFAADERVARARRNVQLSLREARGAVRPRVLFVIAGRGGGTARTNEDLMGALAGRIEPMVLQSDGRVVQLSAFEAGTYRLLERRELREALRPFPHRSGEYDGVVRSWLIRYGIEAVHVRHIARHGLGLFDVARELDIPVAYSVHDFYSVCPNVKLLDERLVHCAGRCTSSPGDCTMELWPPNADRLKGEGVLRWREQMGIALESAATLITTSEAARRLTLSHFPTLSDRPFEIIPHGRGFAEWGEPPTPPRPGEALRVLVAGTISPAKGALVVNALAGLKLEGVELHLFGAFTSDVDPAAGIVVHGAYDREAFVGRVQAIRPHLGAVLSIWPETWCHTLTELWAAGLPVLGFPLGAVGERLADTGAGWLAATPNARGVADVLEAILADPRGLEQANERVRAWQHGMGREQSLAAMAAAYWRVYEVLLNGRLPLESVEMERGSRFPTLAEART